MRFCTIGQTVILLLLLACGGGSLAPDVFETQAQPEADEGQELVVEVLDSILEEDVPSQDEITQAEVAIEDELVTMMELTEEEGLDGEPVEIYEEAEEEVKILTAAQCFADQLPPSGVMPIDYDQFHPVIGSHCKGTNHQDIKNVQRVVFAGDSITTGTPPTPMGDWYRNKLAKALASKYGLKAPQILWQSVDLLGSGMTLQMRDGEFWTCAKFGARTDDLLLEPHKQFITCNPPEERNKTTLIVMTIGGNDIFAWAKDLVKGVPIEKLWQDAEKAVKDLEDAIHWAVDDPSTFPNGVYIVFANTYEFSDLDSGKDLANCPGADLISMNTALIDPNFQALSRYFTTEFMRIAVETGTDMVFFGEYACGHGYMRNDPNGRCYRGSDNELWLDITCMHPSSAGHAGLYDLFMSVIEE